LFLKILAVLVSINSSPYLQISTILAPGANCSRQTDVDILTPA
jgi:hypothetical protein